MTGIFFYRDKPYQTFEEWLEASRAYMKQEMDEKAFLDEWQKLGKDIFHNLELRQLKLTGKTCEQLLRIVLYEVFKSDKNTISFFEAIQQTKQELDHE